MENVFSIVLSRVMSLGFEKLCDVLKRRFIITESRKFIELTRDIFNVVIASVSNSQGIYEVLDVSFAKRDLLISLRLKISSRRGSPVRIRPSASKN